MSQRRQSANPADAMGALGQIVLRLRLVWRLLVDPRVPVWPKLIIPASALYILSPVDLVPDFILGLGQVDDIGIFFLGISFFVQLCPPAIVEEHRRALRGAAAPPHSEEDVVEGSYRVVDDDDSSR